MDQDSFRKLLASRPSGASNNQSTRGSLLPSKSKAASQTSAAPTPKSEFKPRKVKKTVDSAYRDRATERRQGKAGDFAQAESLLEDFEKRHADDEDKAAVEMQRNYLGGDAEHTVLVKGLDFALLEQAKARAEASESILNDELLEAAFRGDASQSPPPAPEAAVSNGVGKKRTREDILRELKVKREDENGTDKSLDEAKKEGKFKPIGFKPIGGNASKAKGTKDKEGRKKKKRKVGEKRPSEDAAKTQDMKPTTKTTADVDASSSTTTKKPETTKGPAVAADELPPDDDFDIFAGAGDYEGIDLGDDDESGDDKPARLTSDVPASSDVKQGTTSPPPEMQPQQGGRWFNDLEPSPPPERPLPSAASKDTKGKGRASPSPSSNAPAVPRSDDEEGEIGQEEGEAQLDREEPARPARLAGLASSTIPSIRDILAADEALEKEDKRRARKEKRKAGGGGGTRDEVSAEAKLNRDYQKLQAYTKKKGDAV